MKSGNDQSPQQASSQDLFATQRTSQIIESAPTHSFPQYPSRVQGQPLAYDPSSSFGTYPAHFPPFQQDSPMQNWSEYVPAFGPRPTVTPDYTACTKGGAQAQTHHTYQPHGVGTSRYDHNMANFYSYGAGPQPKRHKDLSSPITPSLHGPLCGSSPINNPATFSIPVPATQSRYRGRRPLAAPINVQEPSGVVSEGTYDSQLFARQYPSPISKLHHRSPTRQADASNTMNSSRSELLGHGYDFGHYTEFDITPNQFRSAYAPAQQQGFVSLIETRRHEEPSGYLHSHVSQVQRDNFSHRVLQHDNHSRPVHEQRAQTSSNGSSSAARRQPSAPPASREADGVGHPKKTLGGNNARATEDDAQVAPSVAVQATAGEAVPTPLNAYRNPAATWPGQAPVQARKTAGPKLKRDERTKLFFVNYEDAVRGVPTKADWHYPQNDDTIPETDDEKQEWVWKLYEAFVNLKDVEDKVGSVYLARWAETEQNDRKTLKLDENGNQIMHWRYWDEATLEKVCWEILHIIMRLHNEGPSWINIHDKGFLADAKKESNVTFEKHIGKVIALLRVHKDLCSAMVKGDILKAVLTPNKRGTSARQNRQANDKRQENIKIGRGLSKGQSGKMKAKMRGKSTKKEYNKKELQHGAAITPVADARLQQSVQDCSPLVEEVAAYGEGEDPGQAVVQGLQPAHPIEQHRLFNTLVNDDSQPSHVDSAQWLADQPGEPEMGFRPDYLQGLPHEQLPSGFQIYTPTESRPQVDIAPSVRQNTPEEGLSPFSHHQSAAAADLPIDQALFEAQSGAFERSPQIIQPNMSSGYHTNEEAEPSEHSSPSAHHSSGLAASSAASRKRKHSGSVDSLLQDNEREEGPQV